MQILNLEYQHCYDINQEKLTKLKERYILDKEQKEKFEYTLNAEQGLCDNNSLELRSLFSQIMNKINLYIGRVEQEKAKQDSIAAVKAAEEISRHLKATTISFDNEDKIEYNLPSEGTVEMWINVKEGCEFNNYKLNRGANTIAQIYSTTGQDAWWPGSTWFTLSNNGDIDLWISTTKGAGNRQNLKATNSSFKFNQWHKVGFSYGHEGQFIFLDGQIVASNQNNTQFLNYMNDCKKSIFGYFKSCVWQYKQYDQGFTGSIDALKVSDKQNDWN